MSPFSLLQGQSKLPGIFLSYPMWMFPLCSGTVGTPAHVPSARGRQTLPELGGSGDVGKTYRGADVAGLASRRYGTNRTSHQCPVYPLWGAMRNCSVPLIALSLGLPIQGVLAAPRFALWTILTRNARAFDRVTGSRGRSDVRLACGEKVLQRSSFIVPRSSFRDFRAHALKSLPGPGSSVDRAAPS